MLETVLAETQFSQVVKGNTTEFVWIDLSKNNGLLGKVNTSNTEVFAKYVNQFLNLNKAKIAVGGYNEPRNIYKRSKSFNSGELEERFIHLGVDLWTNAKTPVFAPLKGKIHSFKNNLGEGNYGPTIILAHQLKGQSFYTLYGHLTSKSLEKLKVGDVIESGEAFASVVCTIVCLVNHLDT